MGIYINKNLLNPKTQEKVSKESNQFS